jgi:geranylgeranyl pyrophosphate synthase
VFKHFRPTLLGHHSADEALIIGDLLVLQAQTLIRQIMIEVSDQAKVIEIIKTFESFFNTICEGEFLEISIRNNIEIDLEKCHQVLWKYSSDIEACSRLGAILGDGSKKQIHLLSKYGRHLGYIIRLVEDVSDILNREGALIPRLRNESVPLPLLYSAKQSEKLFQEVNTIINKTSISNSDIRQLLDICFETEAFSYVQNIAKINLTKGINCLNSFKPSQARHYLALMIEEMANNCSVS